MPTFGYGSKVPLGSGKKKGEGCWKTIKGRKVNICGKGSDLGKPAKRFLRTFPGIFTGRIINPKTGRGE